MQYRVSMKNTFLNVVGAPCERRQFRSFTFDCSSCYDSDAETIVEFEISSDLSSRYSSASSEPRESMESLDMSSFSDAESLDSTPLAELSNTTVMIRNIPNRYTQESLIEEIDSTVEGADFVYLPINFNKKTTNLGYAFVNFPSAAAAEEFMAAFDGHQFIRQPQSLKRAQIGYAKVQGKEANIEQYAARAAEGVLKFWTR
jgi:RNA recognition motif-containing protein